MRASGSREPRILLGAAALAVLVSGVQPHDRLTWLLEVLPILIGAPILVLTFRLFPLTPLLYRLLLAHALILALGGHYTSARVPLGFWAQSLFDLGRNHYDRLGHFAQGFVPAILTRELLVRCSPLASSRWLPFLVVAVCLAFSACYEIFEWWSAVLGGEAAESFLGTQGDVWDTQWDMFLALVGAIAALLLLARRHDRALDRMLESGSGA